MRLRDFIQIAVSAAFLFAAPGTKAQGQITETPPIRDSSGALVPGGYASLEEVTLGGVDQWILIRTQSTGNPVLLFLHGGPGLAPTPWVDRFQPAALEREFTVVHWDQRGAGKSYDPALTLNDLRTENLVSDTLELVDILRKRFDQDRIFLVGHSWGSALGFLTVARDSDPFHAFVASGERVSWVESHQIAFEWVKEQAEAGNVAPVLDQIASIKPFDVENEAHVQVLYRGLGFFRGGDVYTPGLWDEMLAYAMEGRSPYYTIEEVQTYIAGVEITQAAIEPFAATYDLFESFRVSAIPVHFIQGEHDHNAPEILSRRYFDFLEAPDKSYVVIPGAGHSMMYDQPDAWAAELIAIKRRTLGE